VPLDANEEAEFHRITAQLRAEDPALGRPTRWRRARDAFGHGAALVVLAVALVALPLALLSGFYPLGWVGYLAATLAAVRLADGYLPRRRRRPVATAETAPAAPGRDRSRLIWGAVAATTAVVAVIVVSPGTADRATSADPAPTAPAVSSPQDGPDDAASADGTAAARDLEPPAASPTD
jgi:hypothetical protein